MKKFYFKQLVILFAVFFTAFDASAQLSQQQFRLAYYKNALPYKESFDYWMRTDWITINHTYPAPAKDVKWGFRPEVTFPAELLTGGPAGFDKNFLPGGQGFYDYAFVGLSDNDYDNTTMSQWLISPMLRDIKNGDVIKFITRAKNLENPIDAVSNTLNGTIQKYSQRADRLEVRLNIEDRNKDTIWVGKGPDEAGDFKTLLLTINPNLDQHGYPTQWTEYTITISGLPANKAYNGRIGFWYHFPHAGFKNCCARPMLPTIISDPSIEQLLKNPLMQSAMDATDGVLEDEIPEYKVAKALYSIYSLGYQIVDIATQPKDNGYNGGLIGLDDFQFIPSSSLYLRTTETKGGGVAKFTKDESNYMIPSAETGTLLGYVGNHDCKVNWSKEMLGAGIWHERGFELVNLTGADITPMYIEMVGHYKDEFSINMPEGWTIPAGSSIPIYISIKDSLYPHTPTATFKITYLEGGQYKYIAIKLKATIMADIPPVAHCKPSLSFPIGITGIAQNGVKDLTAGDLINLMNDNSTYGCEWSPTFSILNKNYTPLADSTIFTCNDGKSFPLYLQVSGSGNQSTCSTTINLTDSEKPQVNCYQDQTYYLSTNESAMPKDSLIPPPVSDNCGASISGPYASRLKTNVTDEFGPGDNYVYWEASDSAGNADGCSKRVTVIDTIKPVAKCKSVVEGYFYDELNTFGFMKAIEFDNGSTDNVKPYLYQVSSPSFNNGDYTQMLQIDCSNSGISYPLTLKVSDASGNYSTCATTLNMPDAHYPTCKQTTIYLPPSTQMWLQAKDVLNLVGKCGPTNVALSKDYIDCMDAGKSFWDTITYTDIYNVQQTCYSRITVAQEAAMPSCTDTVTLYTTGDVANFTFDTPAKFTCEGNPYYSVYVSGRENFTIDSLTQPITQWFRAGISNVNSSTYHLPRGLYYCKQTLVVIDTAKPQIAFIPSFDSVPAIDACSRAYNIKNPFTTYSYVYINYALSGATTGSGYLSSHYNAGINAYESDPIDFNQGITHVTLTAYDGSDNSTTVSYDVKVYGTLPNPSLLFTELNAAWTQQGRSCDGTYKLHISSPLRTACGETDYMWFYRVKDDNGTVLYEQDSIPQASGADIPLRASINNGSPAINNYVFLGYHEKMYSSPMESGNVNVIVYDTLDQVVCHNDTTVTNLNSSSYTYDYTLESPIASDCSTSLWSYTVTGATSLTSGATPTLAYNVSSVLTLNNGVNTITITSKEFTGLTSQCTFKVTVLDGSTPTMGCPSDVTLHRSDISSCKLAIGGTCAQVSGFTSPFDNTKIKLSGTSAGNITLDKSNMPSNINLVSKRTQTSFGKAYIAIPINCSGSLSFNWEYKNTIYYSWTPFCVVNSFDPGANYSRPNAIGGFTDISTPTVQTGTFSQLVNAGDVVYIGLVGAGYEGTYFKISNFSAPYSDPTTQIPAPSFTKNDALYFTSDVATSYDIGTYDIHYTLTNNNKNEATCTQKVTVVDDYATSLACQDITLYLDRSGYALLKPSQVVSTCFPITSTTLSKDTFDCSNLGVNSVTITTITQTTNDTLSCTFNVTVLDTIKPVPSSNVLSVSLDYYGNGSLPDSVLRTMFVDNCSISSVITSKNSFSCQDAGMNTITLTASDSSGNTATYTLPVQVYPYGFDLTDPDQTDSVCVGEYKSISPRSGSLENPLMYQWQIREKIDSLKPWSFYTCSSNMQQIIPQATGFKFYRNNLGKYLDDTYMAYMSSVNMNSTVYFKKLNPVSQTWDPIFVPLTGVANSTSAANNPFYLDFYDMNNSPYVVYIDNAGALKINNFNGSNWVPIDTTIYWTINQDFSQLYFNDGYFFPVKWNGVVEAGKEWYVGANDMWYMHNDGNTSYSTYVTNAKNIVGLRNTLNQNVFYKLNVTSNDYTGYFASGYANTGGRDSLTVDPTDNSPLFVMKSFKDEAYIAYKSLNGKACVKKFDGTSSWSNVGALDFSSGEIFKLDIGVVNDTLYIIYVETSDQIQVKKWNGNTWVDMVSPSSTNSSLTSINSIKFVDIAGVPSFYIDYKGAAHYTALLRNDGWKDIYNASSLYPVNTSVPSDNEYRCIATKSNCTSTTSGTKRVIVKEIPKITASDVSILNQGTVNLTATATAGSINWLSGSGILLMQDSSYAPYLTEDTLFKVYANNGQCYSDTLDVYAYVNDNDIWDYKFTYKDTVCYWEESVISLDTAIYGYAYSLYKKGADGKFTLTAGPTVNPSPNYSVSVYPTSTTEYKIKIEEYNLDAASSDVWGPKHDYFDLGKSNLSVTNSVTIEAWIYNMNTTNSSLILSHLYSSGGPYDALSTRSWEWNSGAFKVYNGNNARQLAFPTLPSLGWVHVATTAGPNGMAIYYNGQLVASNSLTSNENINYNTNSNMTIGLDIYGSPAATYMKGVDEFSIWNIERSATEIQSSMNSCLNGNEQGLLMYNNFSNYNPATQTFSSIKGNDVVHKVTAQLHPLFQPQMLRNGSCMDTVKSEKFLPSFTVYVAQERPVVATTSNYYTSSSVCGNDTITVNATASAGLISWYNTETLDSLLGTGNSFTTVVDKDTVFYVGADRGCAVYPVYVDVNGYPEVLSTTNDTICYNSYLSDATNIDATVNNEASGFKWYDSPTGGNLVDIYGGGMLTQSDTLYAEAYNFYCVSLTRLPVYVVVKPEPIITSYADSSRCEAGSVELHATANVGHIEWWNELGNYLLDTGSVFITPSISSTTAYRAYVNDPTTNHGNCYSNFQVVTATINNFLTKTDTVKACDSYTWIDGITYTTSNNTAQYIKPNATGCDSLIYLNLTINSIADKNVSIDKTNMCIGDSAVITVDSTQVGVNYTLRNNSDNSIVAGPLAGTGNSLVFNSGALSSSASYNVMADATTIISPGVDSITCSKQMSKVVSITVGILASTQRVSTCSSYTWNNKTYTTSGTYSDTIPSSLGCDSVATLNLTIRQASIVVETVAACDSFTWHGVTYTTSTNTPTWKLGTNSVGCDSMVTLHLTINNSNTGTDVQTACNSYTWIDGNTYTSSNNTATWTLTNAAGCDSVVTLNLTINNSNTGTDVQTACDSYTWIDGNTYTSSNNTATWTLTNAAGCDSVVTLHLTINNSNTGDTSVVACNSFTWYSTTYTTSGTPTRTFTNAAGCDSVLTLHLTINNSNTGSDVVTACGSYTWIDGNTYTSSNNTATWTLTNAAGCDSVVTLHLIINTPTTGDTTAVACDSFNWYGTNYTANGTPTHVLTNAAGCDSTLTLHLTIHALPVPTITGANTSCARKAGLTYITESGMTGYTWTVSAGGTITSGGSATDSIVTITWNSSGAQTVSVNYNDGNSCTAASATVYAVTVAPGCNLDWTGATSTDWNTVSNWNLGFVPSIYDNVSITALPNEPIVNQQPSTPAVCNDLSLGSLASVIVNAGKALTVGGNVANNGTITLKSDVSGTATLVNYGTITGSGTYNVEQYLTGTGGATPNGPFWYMTSPLSGATSNVFDAGGTNKLWSYSEVTNAYTAITDNATTLLPANGYVTRLGADTTINFTGSAFNTGNISTAALSSTATSGNNMGYNLIGNPYPSHLDWEAIDLTNFSSSVWYRTRNSAGISLFDTYNGVSHIGTNNNGNGAVTQYIPPMQAVWVKAFVNNSTMNFTNAMRSHQANNNLHKTSAVNELIRLTLNDGNTSDETVINFNSNASDAFEVYDSEKKWGTNVPQLYSITTAKDTLVINTLNNLNVNTVVDLGIKTLNEGQYSIIATENGVTLPPILWDKTLNVKQDLTINPKYAFRSTATNDGNRFALIFEIQDVTGISSVENEANLVQIYQSTKNLMVVLNGNSKPEGIINVYDVIGRKILTREITGNINSIYMDNAIGVYIVQVLNKNQVVNKKIVMH